MEISSGNYTALVPDHLNAQRPDSPVVVIGGWAGAQDRSLKKYAELIASMGFISVRSVQPTSHIFSPIERPRRRWALSLLQFLEQQSFLPHRPLVLYAFSNGGAFVVEQIKKIAESDLKYSYLRSSVQGFIFDSAPGYMHPHLAPRVLEAEMPAGIRRSLITAALMTATSLTPLLYGDRKAIYWDQMESLDWGRPFLFLYSDDDPLCDAARLTNLIATKRAKGQQVEVVRWAESEHCGHLKMHRAEYVAALAAFLRNVAPAPAPRL